MYIILCSLAVVLVVGERLQTTPPSDSNSCARYDCESRLLERLIKAEFAQREIEAFFLQLQRKFNILERDALRKEIQRPINDASNATGTNHKQPTVAFYAGLSHDIGDVTIGYRAIMDRVFLNQEEVYDARHGSFRAPFKGLYEFSVHVCSPPSKYAILYMMKEGQSVGFTYSGGPYWSCSSRSAVVMMQEGENIWVEMDGYAAGMISKTQKHVEFRTSFSGFYIGTI